MTDIELELRDTKMALNQARQQLITAQYQILQYQMGFLKEEEKQFVVGEISMGDLANGTQG